MLAGIIGAFASTLIAFGGGLVATGEILGGLFAMGLGAITLGTMFAAIQSKGPKSFAFDTREGLTLNQLWLFLKDATDLTADTTVYLGTEHGLYVASGLFTCVLDGRKALVIEVEDAE